MSDLAAEYHGTVLPGPWFDPREFIVENYESILSERKKPLAVMTGDCRVFLLLSYTKSTGDIEYRLMATRRPLGDYQFHLIANLSRTIAELFLNIAPILWDGVTRPETLMIEEEDAMDEDKGLLDMFEIGKNARRLAATKVGNQIYCLEEVSLPSGGISYGLWTADMKSEYLTHAVWLTKNAKDLFLATASTLGEGVTRPVLQTKKSKARR